MMEEMEKEWLDTWEAMSTPGTLAAGQPKNEKEYNKFWLKKYETTVEKGFLDCAYALNQIKIGKIYKDNYSTWKDYLKKRWSRSSEWWQKLQQSAQVIDNLKSSTNGTLLPSNERQARELAPLEIPEQVQVWQEVIERFESTEITAEKIKEVKQEILEPEVDVVEIEEQPIHEVKMIQERFDVMADTGDGEIEMMQVMYKKAIELKAGKKYTDWLSRFIIYKIGALEIKQANNN